MAKPETLKDLLRDGHISLGEVRRIAKNVFDGKSKIQGLEGYTITAFDFDSLPDYVQQFIIKGFLECKVTNILDSQMMLIVD